MKSEKWSLKNALRFSSLLIHYYLLPITCSSWSVWMDSNHRPHAYQACALTTWATDRYSSRWDLVRVILQPYISKVAGGDDGVRTHDPLLAGQVLSQLSYTPICSPSGSLLFQGSFWSSKIEQRKVNLLYKFISSNWLMPISEYEVIPQECFIFSIERRWSSRTFRYGYLVTT